MTTELDTLIAERNALVARLSVIHARIGMLRRIEYIHGRNGERQPRMRWDQLATDESMEVKLARTEQLIAELKQEKRW